MRICDKAIIVNDDRDLVGVAYADSSGSIQRKSPSRGKHRAYNPRLGREDPEGGGLDPIRLHAPSGNLYVVRGNNDTTEARLTREISQLIRYNGIYAERMKTRGERHHNFLLLKPLHIIDASRQYDLDELRQTVISRLQAQGVPQRDIKAVVSLTFDPYGPGAHIYLQFGAIVISKVIVHAEVPGSAVRAVLRSFRFHRYDVSVIDIMRLMLAAQRITFY